MKKFISLLAMIFVTMSCVSCNNETTNSVSNTTSTSTSEHQHNLVHHDKKEPTCEQKGYEAYDECKDCDYTTYVEIPALGHKGGNPVEKHRKEATCETDGSYEEVVYCTRCNKELSRVTKIIGAPGHTLKETAKVVNGVTVIEYSCENCDYSYEEKCAIETSEGFDINYDGNYPTLNKTVNNSMDAIALLTIIKVSNKCTWVLSKDVEGIEVINTKNLSLKTGHNYAYITVWYGEKYNSLYMVDIYRLDMYSYKFVSDNKVIASNNIEENSLINEISQPTKEGNTFMGWYDEKGNKVSFPYVAKSNKTFTAKWVANKYKITFDTDGGTTIDSITQDYGTNIVKPNNPTKEG